MAGTDWQRQYRQQLAAFFFWHRKPANTHIFYFTLCSFLPIVSSISQNRENVLYKSSAFPSVSKSPNRIQDTCALCNVGDTSPCQTARVVLEKKRNNDTMSGKSPQARPRGLTHGGSSANIPPPRGGQRTRAESSPQDRPPQVDLLGNRYPSAAVKPPPRDRSASMNQRKPDSSDLHGMPTPNRKPEDKDGDSVNNRQRSESQRKTPAPTFRPNSQARNDDQQFAQTISSGTAVTPSRNLPPRRTTR